MIALLDWRDGASELIVLLDRKGIKTISSDILLRKTG